MNNKPRTEDNVNIPAHNEITTYIMNYQSVHSIHPSFSSNLLVHAWHHRRLLLKLGLRMLWKRSRKRIVETSRLRSEKLDIRWIPVGQLDELAAENGSGS
jgi:hypothetical protein